MGCFGYLCSGCGEQIVGEYSAGGEHCVLIHVRHGKEVGRAVGHYNEYGGVVEDERFRSSDERVHKNSHDEICASEMDLPDSMMFYGRKWLDGKSWATYDLLSEYRSRVAAEMTEASYPTGGKIVTTLDVAKRWVADGHEEKYKDFLSSLQDAPVASGIIAYHKACYEELPGKKVAELPFSLPDPDQSWGEINPKYI